MTEPDVDPGSWTDDELATYINDNAETVADLPDDAPAADLLRANMKAALAEFRARNGDNSEDLTVDAVVDVEVDPDEDHYLRHVTDASSDFKGRHDQAVRTEVEDGHIVHHVFESVDDVAHPKSVSWSRPYFTSCPACGADVGDPDADDGDTYVQTWVCPDCPWEHRRASTKFPSGVGDDPAKPLWSRTAYPHDFDEDHEVDWEGARDDADDVESTANLLRRVYLTMKAKATATFNDAAYVGAEYEGEGDDREKVADPYVDKVECGHCGDEVDAPATVDHAHFGDVCPDCEDVTVWSVDDADLPDDVEDRMADHKSFDRSRIVDLLRDVIYWGNYVAGVDARKDSHMFDAEDDVDPDDVGPIKTGKQGRHSTGQGDKGRPGTGLRRPQGFAHNFRYFRTVLSDAAETGLIRRVDGADTDVDDPDAAWESTDKGRRVFDELSRCRTCGESRVPMIRTSTYKVGRRTKRDFSLTTACPTCDDLRSPSDGALVLESSGTDWSLSELRGVEYDVA